MGWYKSGTVNLAHGVAQVAGVGTDFVSYVTSGAIFCGPDGQIYEVDRVESATSLYLVKQYAGATVAGAPYAVAPTQSYIADLGRQAANLLNTFSGFRDDYIAGNLVGAGLKLKGVLNTVAELPATGADGDAYLIDGSLYVWAKAVTGWRGGSIRGPKGDVGDVNPANIAAAASAQDGKTQAATSAAQALDSKNAAAQSATNAATDRATAQAAATTATGAATTATNAATAAGNSATAAATSATNSAGSASTASTAAASLVAALASFKARFVGEFASDPALDGNGHALMDGAEYFNTTTDKLRIYANGQWHDYDETAQTATSNALISAANAASSAANAVLSATAAGNAKTATATMLQQATDQASAAAGSATTASTQAGIATTKAQAAKNSADAAALSAQQAAAGQVAVDWNAPSGVTAILNKPTIPSTPAGVGLSHVDNTADVDKPVSTAQATALALKADLSYVKSALGSDANFAATTATALATRLRFDMGTQGLTPQQQANAAANLGLDARITAQVNAQLGSLTALIYAGL